MTSSAEKVSDEKPFRVGDGTPGPGRKKGIPNRLTREAKEAIATVFERMGEREGKSGTDKLLEWAETNPSEFYTKLYAKLIPLQVNANSTVTHEVERSPEEAQQYVKDYILQNLVAKQAAVGREMN